MVSAAFWTIWVYFGLSPTEAGVHPTRLINVVEYPTYSLHDSISVRVLLNGVLALTPKWFNLVWPDFLVIRASALAIFWYTVTLYRRTTNAKCTHRSWDISHSNLPAHTCSQAANFTRTTTNKQEMAVNPLSRSELCKPTMFTKCSVGNY
jgi:hypothetical protein